jgi:hypothetical protein
VVLLRHVLAGNVELAERAAIITLDCGRRLRMTWNAQAEVSLERQEITDPLLRASWGGELTRLTLRVAATTGSVTTRWEAT